jgi:hypothetical protein
MNGLIGLLITLIVMGLVFYLVIWFVDYIGLPEPFNKVIKVVVGLVVLLYLLGVLAGAAPPLGTHYWH